jgi:hypothetical protein
LSATLGRVARNNLFICFLDPSKQPFRDSSIFKHRM